MTDLSGNIIDKPLETKKVKKSRDPDFFKNYCKKWYNDNKEYHNKYCKEKIECECGDKICRSGLIKHRKTNRHNSNMFKLNKGKILDPTN